jgi:LPXTG-motif cell wall-anchored protein
VTSATNTTGNEDGTSNDRASLASTGDPTSYLPIIIAGVAGIVLVVVAIFFRRKNR